MRRSQPISKPAVYWRVIGRGRFWHALVLALLAAGCHEASKPSALDHLVPTEIAADSIAEAGPVVVDAPPVASDELVAQATLLQDGRPMSPVQAQYQQITLQLEQLRRTALQDPEVQSGLQKLEDSTKRAMLQRHPELQDQIARVDVLIREISDSNSPTDDISGVKMDEYQSLKNELKRYQDEALANPDMARLRDEYLEILIRVMQRIEPRMGEWVENRDQLQANIRATRPGPEPSQSKPQGKD